VETRRQGLFYEKNLGSGRGGSGSLDELAAENEKSELCSKMGAERSALSAEDAKEAPQRNRGEGRRDFKVQVECHGEKD